MRKLGVLGSIALDNIFTVDAVPVKGQRVFGTLLGQYRGGMGANQAVEAARYLDKVEMLGAVGNDAPGGDFTAYLNGCGVGTDWLVRTAAATGQTYMYLVDGKSDYFSVVAQGANLAPVGAAIDSWLDELAGGVLLASLEINPQVAERAIEKAKKRGIYIYLCPSPAEVCSLHLMELADALILNQLEAKLLLGIPKDGPNETARRLAALSTEHDLILLTLGKEGALLKEKGAVYHAPIFDVQVLDTVGAGDALAGAFVAARERGLPPYQALSVGCIAGSLAVSVVGAQSSTHTLQDVEALYRLHYQGKEGKHI